MFSTLLVFYTAPRIGHDELTACGVDTNGYYDSEVACSGSE